MTETRIQYETKTEPRRNYWICTACRLPLGDVVSVGDAWGLYHRGAVILGDAWVRCSHCGNMRRWVPARRKTQNPPFIDEHLKRAAIVRELIAQAEREVAEMARAEREAAAK